MNGVPISLSTRRPYGVSDIESFFDGESEFALLWLNMRLMSIFPRGVRLRKLSGIPLGKAPGVISPALLLLFPCCCDCACACARASCASLEPPTLLTELNRCIRFELEVVDFEFDASVMFMSLESVTKRSGVFAGVLWKRLNPAGDSKRNSLSCSGEASRNSLENVLPNCSTDEGCRFMSSSVSPLVLAAGALVALEVEFAPCSKSTVGSVVSREESLPLRLPLEAAPWTLRAPTAETPPYSPAFILFSSTEESIDVCCSACWSSEMTPMLRPRALALPWGSWVEE